MSILRSTGATIFIAALVSLPVCARACPVSEFDQGRWTRVRTAPDFGALSAAQLEIWRGHYYDFNGALGLSFSDPAGEAPRLVVAVHRTLHLLESHFDSEGQLELRFASDGQSEVQPLLLRVTDHGLCWVSEEGSCHFYAERMAPSRAARLQVEAAVWRTLNGVAEAISGTADAAVNWAIDFTNRIGWK